MQMEAKQRRPASPMEELTTHKSTRQRGAMIHAQVLTDFAKLKKLLVSPVTMLDEPADERVPSQALVNGNWHHLLHMERRQLSGAQLAKA